MKIRRLVNTVLAVGVMLLSFQEGGAYEAARVNPVWEQLLHSYRNNDDVKHLILVQCLDDSKANVQVYEKDTLSNAWTIIRATDGYIGRCGCSDDKREGDGKTPMGDFGIITAFGIKPNPGTAIEYLDITDDMYAVDTNTPYYNKIASNKDGKKHQGEHMIEYSPEYNYGIFLDYNKECVYGKGSAIFLHCKGPKPYTGG